MGKIVRREFMGNRLYFFLLCALLVTIPFAILYLVEGTIRIEDDLADPELFVQKFRSGSIGKA